jgi:hypothetical protein
MKHDGYPGVSSEDSGDVVIRFPGVDDGGLGELSSQLQLGFECPML